MPGNGGHKKPQCEYREGGRRCRRNGTGTPTLCRAHRLVLEQEADRDQRPPAGAGLADLFDRFVTGKPISMDHLFDGLSDVLRAVGSQPRPPNGRPYPTDPISEMYRNMRGQRPPPPPDPEIVKQDEIRKARRVMGFKVGEPIEATELKLRHRKLVMRHHPDRGGSLEKMQEINAANDVLQGAMG